MNRATLFLGLVNIAYLLGFGGRFIYLRNYEFVIYVGVILVVMIWIGLTLTRVQYAMRTLVGLTLWGLMHVAGGGIPVETGRLYDVILIPLSQSLPILRYDQVVHMVGFGVCTWLCYDLLKGQLDTPKRIPFSLVLVLVMAGLGFGAFNEILEFLVPCTVPEAGVGGYMNTALDLCANLIGAVLAMMVISLRADCE